MNHLLRLFQLSVICLTMTVIGCSPFTAVDKPIEHWKKDLNQQAINQSMAGRSNDMLVLVAFSGGGTRAAAFAYGVLKELADTRVTTDAGSRPLLHEIDMISSVSGGSFTSAYFGLHGDRIFDDFEERFLRKNIQGALIGRVLNPLNLIRRMSPSYSKADMVSGYYDTTIFDNATFADFARANAPIIVINSTDVASGNRFPFKQAMFDLICSDLSLESPVRGCFCQGVHRYNQNLTRLRVSEHFKRLLRIPYESY